MTHLLIGCGQITWASDTPETQILAEIAQAGYDGAPARPKAGRTAAELVALYGRYHLLPAPGYFGADFWRVQQQDRILEDARAYARFMRQAGCRELYVAAGGFYGYVTAGGRNRAQLAGHVGPQDGLSAAEFDQFAQTLERVGEISLQEGVRSCFHNHAGSVVETGAEIERLLDQMDPQLVFLGPDTGHLAWGGVDVLDFFRRHAGRILTAHLKDVRLEVIARGRAGVWDYAAFEQNGIFAELGEGDLDFPAIIDILLSAGFGGDAAEPAWLIAETDVTQKATPLESAVASRNYLRQIGF